MSDYRPSVGQGARWVLSAVAIFVLLVIIFTVGIFGLKWFQAGVDIYSPDNVKAQYHDAYTRYESLTATACNVKKERALVQGSASNLDIQAQYQQQETAYEQNYVRISAEYNAAYDNAFAAARVGPGDLPKRAPSLEGAIGSASC